MSSHGAADFPETTRPAGPASTGQRILVTGGTGFIGRHLVDVLRARGDDVLLLSRNPARAALQFGVGVQVIGDLATLPVDTRIDAIVNLAGATILALPWTTARRRVLRDSRISTTRALVDLCRRLARAPATLVSASAVGYYGVRGAEPLDETAAPQDLFQSRLCRDWEQEAGIAESLGLRVVCLRFGIVLGRRGGALPQLARPVRGYLGARLGSGRQGAPWIHIEDAVRLIVFALDEAGLSGPLNAVAPGHTTQAGFMQALGRALHRPVWLRVPAFALRMLLGEMAQLLVDGQHVLPARALSAGFRFRYPQLDPALQDLLGNGGSVRP
jgi:uncharacterized protein (TIGR01777 family)